MVNGTYNREHPVANCGGTLWICGKKIRWFDYITVESTMDSALRQFEEGCEPWTVVSARRQESGRGTHGRSWFSPEGKGLWMSVVLPPPLKAEYLHDLSLLAAQAVIESLTKFTTLRFEIKYPNDVIINERKIAGILFESVTNGEAVRSVILGVGINFFQSRKDFNDVGLTEATSLVIETGGYTPDISCFIISFLECFIPLYEKSVLKKKHGGWTNFEQV
jgi:BirA family biotin operon repressor/biotin-[acetyl-CoA-carboxylase] ligase